MANDLTLTVEKLDKAALLHLKGDLTTFAEEAVESEFNRLLNEGCRLCVFDFSQVEYINSPGIAILIQVVSAMREKGGSIGVYGLNDHYKKIFKMVGLSQYIEQGDTLEEVLQKNHG